MLSKKCKDKITATIIEAEENSDAEIICVAKDDCIDKKFLGFVAAVVVTLVVSIILALFSDISKIFFLQVQVILILVLGKIFIVFTKLPKFLLTKNIKSMLTKALAFKNFHALGYDKCKNSIMFFICKDTKQAHIITGKNITAKVSNDVWEKIINEFSKDIPNNDFEAQILKAIEQICKIATEKILPTDKNINEIQNEVVEIK